MKIKVTKINVYMIIIGFSLSCFSIFSCSDKRNYIIYYNKVAKIDSIYRIANQPKHSIRKYRKLFRKYDPRNQERIEEFETYIRLSDQYNKDFGGKKSLYKLIELVAPYGTSYQELYPLCQKYNIDSMEVKNRVMEWKRGLNKKLVDSFSIAMVRDQMGRPDNKKIVKMNLEKNAALFLWTFENYGFPSNQKIGRLGNDDVFIAMPTLLSHMIASEKYPQIKIKIYEYLKSGDCPPSDYALMVDTYDQFKNTGSIFHYRHESQDSLQINRNRKSIGLPSLRHGSKIRKDFLSKLKNK